MARRMGVSVGTLYRYAGKRGSGASIKEAATAHGLQGEATAWRGADRSSPTVVAVAPTRPRSHRDHRPCGRGPWHLHLDPLPGVARAVAPQAGAPERPWCGEGRPEGRGDRKGTD